MNPPLPVALPAPAVTAAALGATDDPAPAPGEKPDEPEPAKGPAPPPDPETLEEVVARVVPAVASIQAGQSRGTGFFVRSDALVTNAHVVDGQYAVQLQVGNAAYTARVVSLSKGTDLAILQVLNPNPRQPVLALGSASTARVGEEVIAVGSALGVLSNTVTRGIVSAVRQVGQVQLVQTDAAINPGNSGGPLLDRHGRVIGVNSMTVAKHAGEGVAFAVAIDHASQLLASGRTVDQAQTPLGGLQQMFGAAPEPDDSRTRGEEAYGQLLERVARRADELDVYWNRYERSCVASASRSGDRAWFGVFEAGAVSINPTSGYDCASWLETLRVNGAAIRAAVEQGNDAARRSGVYPGVMRDLRSKYRLSWSGWN